MPSFFHGKGTQVLFNQFDLSAYFDEATPSSVAETAEVTAFGNNSKAYIVGLMDGTIAAKGMFDGSVNAIDADLNAVFGAAGPQLISVVPGGLPATGQTTGMRAISGYIHAVKYEIGAPVGDKVSVQVEFQVTAGLVHGQVLQPAVALAATTTGTGVDNAAASTFGGTGFLHVPANTWNANDTIKVQHSTDNITYVDLITFTVVPATTVTSQAVDVAGTVNRYLRALSTLSAGAGAVTELVTFRRNND